MSGIEKCISFTIRFAANVLRQMIKEVVRVANLNLLSYNSLFGLRLIVFAEESVVTLQKCANDIKVPLLISSVFTQVLKQLDEFWLSSIVKLWNGLGNYFH